MREKPSRHVVRPALLGTEMKWRANTHARNGAHAQCWRRELTYGELQVTDQRLQGENGGAFLGGSTASSPRARQSPVARPGEYPDTSSALPPCSCISPAGVGQAA
ncbi:hypothetical protein NDU88_001349 [Pleurodeles waltl]|uniref:Uncharacterized protein n=1 Tax=Pleurodeles waltl TaxID=8319 RepID=A0AAV7RBC6_PLEWA|nr:hypothetical protein NDU88_001349 [Pleurodeles waltl]